MFPSRLSLKYLVGLLFDKQGKDSKVFGNFIRTCLLKSQSYCFDLEFL